MKDEDCLTALASTQATLTWLGGYCPVQAEGEVDGRKFYFRSRGDSWSLSIDKENPLAEKIEFYYEEDYGKWPEAGYLEDEEALKFIKKGIDIFRNRDSEVDDQEWWAGYADRVETKAEKEREDD